MLMSVYLHKEVSDVLRYYGKLDDVVNKILEYWETGLIDLEDKPPAPPRDGATRYGIDIKNEEYIDLMRRYPPNSPKISLRRLLYWFVENDVFDELEWYPSEDVERKNNEIVKKKLEDAECHIHSVLSKLSSSNKNRACEIIEMLKELRNLL